MPASKRQTPSRSGHWRPQVHFSPLENWTNDPNGLFRDTKGVWHMYYQYGETVDGNGVNKDWGHTTSTNLYDWQDQPVAIQQTDATGSIWSGSAIIDKDNISGFFPANATKAGVDNVLAFFTSWTSAQEAQSVAYSYDGGETFNEDPANPIISLNRHGFRDPKVIFHPFTQKWIMATTFENAVAFWASSDLRNWTQTSQWTPDPAAGFIECPQLLTIPRRRADGAVIDTVYLLLISIGNGRSSGPGGSAVRYMPGRFDGETFTPIVVPGAPVTGTNYWLQDYDFGPDTYATAFWYEPGAGPDDNVLSISWATSTAYAGGTPTSSEGWRHCMTVAREHWLDESYRLISRPADTTPIRQGTIVDEADVTGLNAVYADNPPLEFAWTVRADLAPGGSATASLVFESGETGESVSVVLNVTYPSLSSGSSSSSAKGNITGTVTLRRNVPNWTQAAHVDVWTSLALEPASVTAGSDGTREAAFAVRGILDRSILEVYAGGGAAAGTLLYFAQGDMDQLTGTVDAGAAGKGGGAQFDVKAYILKSSWASDVPARLDAGEEQRVLAPQRFVDIVN
ncbi:Beta-fructofuranosidase [Pleurostoma richardsiae]|uniref:Beta-fructofuranosidase n=1 Tax=Pleurostoma richardsiae TaxID=41990 RepID=A0AA38VX59_9PEZI|nr:Beta-fructofuranosidase [Pleurostoma richardsiae]